MENLLRERYDWVVGLMSSFTDDWVVRVVVALASLSMGLAAALEISVGLGPKTPIPFALHVAAGLYAFLAGLAWLVGRWPGLGVMFGFVIVSDLTILLAIFVVDVPPEIAVAKTAFLIPLGLLAGFFLTGWMFVAHLMVTVIGSLAVAIWAFVVGNVPLVLVFVVWQPVAVVLVGPPVLLLLLVRSARMDAASAHVRT